MSRLDRRLSERKPVATFTGNKIDIMNAVAFDQRIDPYTCRVFHALIYFLNGDNGKCCPSDDLIVALVGGSRKSVYLARIKLRKCGYLDWRKTGRSNRYLFNYAAAKPTLAAVKRMMVYRRERREMLPREAEEVRNEKPLYDGHFNA